MCVQPTFIVGTYNEDGTADFAPITWVSVTCGKESEYMLVISMFGTKNTKSNVKRSGQLTVNLAGCDMLMLVDYFGQVSGRNRIKNDINYAFEKAQTVDAPLLDLSRWVYECEVIDSVNTGAADTFFCRIKNIQIDESIDVTDVWSVDLTKFDPIIYSGQFFSLDRKLGRIGDFYKPKEKV